MRRLSILVVVLLSLVGFDLAAQAGTAAPAGLPCSMAAAGDSITRAYDALLFGRFLADCPQYSWSTGTSSSVAATTHGSGPPRQGVSVTTANVARTGAKMADLTGSSS